MHRTLIQANTPWWRIDFREIWEYRDLLRMLVLMTLTTGNGKMMAEWVVDDLLKYRLGDDGLANTKDDGFASVEEAISKSGMDPALADKISVADRRFVRVVSIGDARGVKSGVWAVFEVGDKKVTPIYWREEQMQ